MGVKADDGNMFVFASDKVISAKGEYDVNLMF